ncbi:MAG: hypothetical protein EB084_25550, partial [Proteobacteria bacterium]|nr:hypothetical protein [Pseudomonadota bacterium]
MAGSYAEHAWERVLAEACSAYDPAKRLEWDPKSNRSGVDVLYDGVGYSCKTTRFRSAEHPRRVVTPSYKLARCRTHADAILEIDRPHRHNFQFYAILARKHADGDADGAIQYEVHTPSSERVHLVLDGTVCVAVGVLAREDGVE